MRRKLTLLVLPPVARITAFVARMATLGWCCQCCHRSGSSVTASSAPGRILGVYCAVMPITRPGVCPEDGSRMRLVIL